VLIYFVAALACFGARRTAALTERRWWTALFILMIVMGINKQLDIQTLFTDIARDVARAQGWYDARRRVVQWDFIVAMVIAGCVATCALFLTVGRKARAWVKLSIVAVCGLGVFVLIRATSFHHVDEMLGLKLGGLRYNTILELGPLLLIVLAAWKARGARDEYA
jgi:hypothetical protein